MNKLAQFGSMAAICAVAFGFGYYLQTQLPNQAEHEVQVEQAIAKASQQAEAEIKQESNTEALAAVLGAGTVKPELDFNELTQGKPSLVNFWATWCSPCLTELPLLSQFQDDNPQFSVIGVSFEEAKQIQDFMKGMPEASSVNMFNAPSEQRDIVARYGNPKGYLPFTLVVDAQGQVIKTVLGELHDKDFIELKAVLSDLSKPPAS